MGCRAQLSIPLLLHHTTSAMVSSLYRWSLAASPVHSSLSCVVRPAASEVSLDTPVCNVSQETALLLGEAAAEHPVIQARFQSMASAIAAAETAAKLEKKQRVSYIMPP